MSRASDIIDSYVLGSIQWESVLDAAKNAAFNLDDRTEWLELLDGATNRYSLLLLGEALLS